MSKRGELTDKAQKIANDFLKRDITVKELRLYSYLQYVMMNAQRLDIEKVSYEERKILQVLREEGHVEGGVTGLSITKDFWDYLCEILFETYVDID